MKKNLSAQDKSIKMVNNWSYFGGAFAIIVAIFGLLSGSRDYVMLGLFVVYGIICFFTPYVKNNNKKNMLSIFLLIGIALLLFFFNQKL